MRKISKSRLDDDVISSTNGSVLNDDHQERENSMDPVEKEPDSDTNESVDKNNKSDSSELSNKKDTSKKGKTSKTKGGKKRKSEKAKKNENAEEEYEVEKIVDSKRTKGKIYYLIRWKGYSASNDTWEPEHTLSCPELINKFLDEKENSKNKDDSSRSKNSNKRKAKKPIKSAKPAKRPKNEWNSENADENAEYEVDRILEVHHKKNGKREFLIHWKGWSTKFDSWEPEDNLNCSELIKKFMDKVNAARSTDSRNLRVAPETTNRFTLQDPTTGRRLSKRRGQRQRVRYDNAE